MNLVKDFLADFDKEWIKEHLINLYRLERKQNFPYYEKAARYAYELMKAEGFEAELLEFPADGKTVYQDKTCPIGWDCTEAKLYVISGGGAYDGQNICDYEKEPLSIAKHSVALPEGGIDAYVFTESQMKAGADVEGAFVLLNQFTRPCGAIIKMMLDLGAIGWISDFQEEGITTDIDSVYWCNANTESGAWVATLKDRDFTSYQVSPRVAFSLRRGCEGGGVRVHATCNGRRYETKQYATTGLLRGEEDKEVWVLSHLYEPLIDDNSNGVIGSIAILKTLKKMQDEGKLKLKYGIRLVFASEMYGMSAVAETYGGDLSKRCIGAVNTDGIAAGTDKTFCKEILVCEAPDLPGFVGNVLMRTAIDRFSEVYPEYTYVDLDNFYGDDNFMSDSSVGLPTVWLRHCREGYHHHGSQNESTLDIDGFVEPLSVIGDLIRSLALTTADEIRELLPKAVERANEALQKAAKVRVRAGTDLAARMDFIRERECTKIRGLKIYADIPEIEEACKQIVIPKIENPEVEVSHAWYDYAANFVFDRAERGFAHDLVNVPDDKRFGLPGSITYGDYADILSRMNGKNTFQDVIREVEWDRNMLYGDGTVKVYLHTALKLAQYGYLSVEIENKLTADDLTEALKALGVKAGDTLLVHSSLSGLGYLENGADAMIDALKAALGPDGTFMAPAFSRPYLGFEGSVNKATTFRPYDTRPNGHLRDKTINTGVLPKTMLKKPDSFRSGHVSHEWVAMGAKAKECMAGHDLLDDPASENSPMQKALDLNGSVVFLGCSIGSNTFLHYLEHMADAEFLHPALVAYIDEDGFRQTAYIRKHLGGCRSFYSGFGGKFYKEAIARGLHIHEVPFGMATLYRMDLRELYDIGLQMYKEDAVGLLCGVDYCRCCQKYRKRKAAKK